MHASAANRASALLSVTIRPAVTMTAEGPDAIGVKIRLAPQTQARLWKADTCLSAPTNSYTIGQSVVVVRQPVHAGYVAQQSEMRTESDSPSTLTYPNTSPSPD
jgi:hypothetical protein